MNQTRKQLMSSESFFSRSGECP